MIDPMFLFELLRYLVPGQAICKFELTPPTAVTWRVCLWAIVYWLSSYCYRSGVVTAQGLLYQYLALDYQESVP